MSDEITELSSLVPGTHNVIRDPHNPDRTPEQIRYEKILSLKRPESNIEHFLPDQNNILFTPRELHNDAEKGIYKDELKASVLTALGTAFKEGTNLHGIYQEIHEAKAADPNTSLFSEIQVRLENLLESPESFEVNGQSLSNDEVEQAINGLRVSRRILIKAAKAAGVFDSLNTQIDQYQENPDYERALDNLEEMKKNPQRLQWEETVSLNRASPDFGGVSTSYINGALFNMEYYLAKAKTKFFGEKAAIEPDGSDKQEYLDWVIANQQLVEALEDVENSENERFLINWGKPRPNLENKAALYLKDKYEPKEVAKPARTITPEEQQQMESFQDRERTSGYNGVVQAIAIGARINPDAFDQALVSELKPEWFDKLPKEYQSMVRAILHINWIAATKRDTAAISTEAWATQQGLRIQRKDLDSMWNKMPGFRIAMATLMKDIFEADKNEFKIIAGQKGKGYDVLRNEDSLDAYKETKIKKLASYLKLQPDTLDWAVKHFRIEMDRAKNFRDRGQEKKAQDIEDDVYRKIAAASINTADRLLFATGAYDSGNQFDETIMREYYFNLLYEDNMLDLEVRSKYDEWKNEENGDLKEERNNWAKLFVLLPDQDRGRFLSMSDDERHIFWEENKYIVKAKAGKINTTSIASDSVRALYKPGQKGVDKWREGTGFGGPTGLWMENNFRVNREVIPGVRFAEALMMSEADIESGRYDEVQKAKIREIRGYLPRRIFFSVFELTEIDGVTNKSNGDNSLTELLLKDQKATIKTQKRTVDANGVENVVEEVFEGLYDYNNNIEYERIYTVNGAETRETRSEPTNELMRKISADELWGDYHDLSSAVRSVHGHVTGGDPRKDRMSKDPLINARIKINKNGRLREIYNNKGFMATQIGLVISPEGGFVENQPELLLAIPEGVYNAAVTSALLDSRFWTNIPDGWSRRRELYKAYHAKDVMRTWNLLFDVFIEGSFVAPRERKRKAISKKTLQEILMLEQEQTLREKLKIEERRRRMSQAMVTAQNP